MNAANENVLMAAQGLEVERQLPTVAKIASHTKPTLPIEDVVTLVERLVDEGYLLLREPDDDFAHYELTERGDEYAATVIARGA